MSAIIPLPSRAPMAAVRAYAVACLATVSTGGLQ